jgi:hypothetical protein
MGVGSVHATSIAEYQSTLGYVDHPQHTKQLCNAGKIPAIFLYPSALVIFTIGELSLL